MGKVHKYRKKPLRFLSLTGFTVEEFDALLVEFERQFYQHMEKYTLTGEKRQGRRYVDYRNCPLYGSDEKLFFILSYCKTRSSYKPHSLLFLLPRRME